ncbi:kinesin-domain-containing protein [Rozella allomycis CSF55]|uniref:Kinesin-like protein n=1 Tax=Rozella allomycis (strain CSF55) TaxID=988480 RepID=A0A075B1E0_ROZAC|nr:Kinesin-like protein KIF22 (Kid) domain-containing protein [Rozella allomycis CSF55]RKP21928.1 kinesin-domain-containing protein [Rozella allomycis CSF55]|eukprot:EPZ36411.1 Kinesin-like protein KIF22 (Kid) domain-containing protein [Rozella allomycis CSF55]
MQSRVLVACRIRPKLSTEEAPECILMDSSCVAIPNPRNKSECLSFKFDHYFNTDTNQENLFTNSIQPLLASTFLGMHLTVFAYGHTSAGKTFTMEGSEIDPGIIPRTLEFLLTEKNKYDNSKIHMSFMEIYNEKVFDLLSKTIDHDLPIREDKDKNITIPDLVKVTINKESIKIELKSREVFEKYFKIGVKNRSTAATKCNANSSRSHSIVLLQVLNILHFTKIESKSKINPNETFVSKLHLIDLAGSEDNRRTGNSGERLKESSAINKSLFVLGQVVDALNSPSPSRRVPYRDSKLTRILQDSLGGKSRALIIANVAPSENYLQETYNTLNFASKSRQIINNPTSNVIDKDRQTKLVAWKESKEKKRTSASSSCSKREREDDSILNLPAKKKIMKPNVDMIQKIKDIAKESIQRKMKKEMELTTKAKIETLEQKLKDANETQLCSIVDILTPVTRKKNAKAFIQKSVIEKQNKNFDLAISFMEKANIYLPNKKIAEEIKKLENLKASQNSSNVFQATLPDKSQPQSNKENDVSNLIKNTKAILKENQNEALNILKQKQSDSLNHSILSNIPLNLPKKKDISQESISIINLCDIKQIKKLKGIGTKRAELIVDFVSQNGPIQNLDQLLQAGLSEKIIQQLKETID